MIKTNKLSINKINPSLRFINLYQCEKGYDSGIRKLYDYYFLYVHSGKGEFIINNTVYNLVSGDLFFCNPNDTNQIIADKDEPFLLTGINFDFTNNFINKTYLYPISIDLFDEKYVTEYVQFTDFDGFNTHIYLQNDETLRKHILYMINIFEAKKKYWKVHVDGLLKTFIAKVVERTNQTTLDTTNINKYNKILDYIFVNYNSDISNDDIASKFHYHPDYINKIIYSYTGLTIKQYIIDLRIKKAINLLMNSNLSISEISITVGYNNINYFSKLFKNKTGFSPALFRNNINN